MDEEVPQAQAVPRRINVREAPILASVANWLCAILGPVSLLIPFITIGVLVWLVCQRRYKSAIVFAASTPMAVAFAFGAAYYTLGVARL
jgi:hypothetical protein